MRRRIAAFLLALALPFLMGADQCSKDAKDSPAGRDILDRPDRVPEPGPDFHATPPGGQTPNPGAGDPKPGDKHIWQVFFSWSPARSPAVTSYQVGPHGLGFGRERRNGHWASPELIVHGDVSAWAEIKLTKPRDVTGSVKCLITKDGHRAPGPNAELGHADNANVPIPVIIVRCSVAKGAK